MMTYDESLRALESIAQNIPNRPSCLCCGYEHNCDRDGCNLLEQVKAVMEQLYKDLSDGQTGCFVCAYRKTPLNQNPCKGCNIMHGQFVNWQWRGVQKEATP